MAIIEENFEVECVKLGKTTTETEKEDATTYRAEYFYETAEHNFVKVVVSSNNPLKAQVGDKVFFKKTAQQQTLMESLDKETKKKPKAEKSDEDEDDRDR